MELYYVYCYLVFMVGDWIGMIVFQNSFSPLTLLWDRAVFFVSKWCKAHGYFRGVLFSNCNSSLVPHKEKERENHKMNEITPKSFFSVLRRVERSMYYFACNMNFFTICIESIDTRLNTALFCPFH